MLKINIVLVSAIIFTLTPCAHAQSPCGTAVKCYEKALEIVKEKIDQIENLEDKVGDLSSELSLFNNAIVGFKLHSCPDGWSEYKPAYGRFLRGIDKSGKNIDPDGQRTLESIQQDGYTRHAHAAGNAYPGARQGWGRTHHPSVTSGPTGYDGGPETRPKNVAVLFCIKNN